MMQSACDIQTKKDKARTTMTTTSQAVCAPTDVCRKRQEPRSPARSRFPGVEGGGLLLYYYLLLVSDFINDVHVVTWQGGFSPCFENPLCSPFRCGEVVAEASFELSRSKSSFCWGLMIHWEFETFDNLLETSTLSLRQLTWDNSAGPCPSATVRGTRKMSLGWTGWAGGLWGRSGWFSDDDGDEGDDGYHWAGWMGWAGGLWNVSSWWFQFK